jgi:hypothetical protein
MPVATRGPLILSNSLILVVISEIPLIPRYPMIRHIMLENRARINQRNSVKSISDPIARDIEAQS